MIGSIGSIVSVGMFPLAVSEQETTMVVIDTLVLPRRLAAIAA